MVWLASVLFVLLVVAAVLLVIALVKLDDTRRDLRDANYRNRTLQESIPDKPECLCYHGINFHDENGCNVITGTQVHSVFRFVQSDAVCECKRYTGPEPLPTYYHPELV